MAASLERGEGRIAGEGVVVGLCIGAEKGRSKTPVDRLRIEPGGVVEDCHFGDEREVAILGEEILEEVRAAVERGEVRMTEGVRIGTGVFAENVLTRGIDWRRVARGARVRFEGGVLLSVLRRGKEICGGCSIERRLGFCIGDRELIFLRVLEGGVLRVGERLSVSEPERDAG